MSNARFKIVAVEKTYRQADPWVTGEQMEDTCCESIPPPPCRKKVESWRGYDAGEVLENLGIDVDDQMRDANGNLVEVLLVRPKTGICGQKETTYELVQQDCCEEVEPLEFDEASSVEVIDQESYGSVAVIGGKAPYAWTIAGTDFFFENGAKKIVTARPWARVLTGPDVCGIAVVSVTDGCSSADYVIRSTIGEWVLISSGVDDPCIISTASINTGCGEGAVFTYISGKHKILESHRRTAKVIGTYQDGRNWCNAGCPTAVNLCIDPFFHSLERVCDYCAICEEPLGIKATAVSLYYKYQYEWKC